MADFTSSHSPSAAASFSCFEKPIAAASSSSPSSTLGGPLVDDDGEDGCCICLEPFTVQDPTTVTSCRHEYHLQCILEWSQRSKECPICWQSFDLKDPTSQPQLVTPRRPSSSETVSFSESLKSKWSIASSRYKESISKGTRGLKEKLLTHNNSVKELGKGVQRDMSAGVAKMIERLDISSKIPEASIPASGGTHSTLNFLFKGKGVQENIIARSLKSEAPSYPSSTLRDKLEASHPQTRDNTILEFGENFDIWKLYILWTRILDVFQRDN